MEPKIGKIVQYRISEKEYRPLLIENVVGAVVTGLVVNGRVFLDIQDNEYQIPHHAHILAGRMVCVRSVNQGEEIGEWRFIPQ